MLHLHRAERADVLVDALADVLAAPLPDPLRAEVVSVPTRGVERWLTQRLAHRLGSTGGRFDGVCANVEFPFPGRLVGEASGAACGVPRDRDPWAPERAVWPLLDVLDESLAEPWLATLAAHLGATSAPDQPRRSRRFGTARHLSDLYDRYSVHRPAMVRSWAAGGGGHWQAELWRRLRRGIGTDSPAERLGVACSALAADGGIVELPERVSIFGLTRLAASYLDVLRALAAHRDVHLFLLHPSPVLWARVEAITRGGGAMVARADDPTASAPLNPLVQSWGRDAREMQLVVTAGGDGVVDTHHVLREAEPVTLLQRIQHAVRDDAAPPQQRTALAADDRSLVVHSCHGRARQVEVVRDSILHVLADDPTLEPRDVIVMCPDIDAFAPLILATFGAGEDVVDDDLVEAEPPVDPARPAGLHVRLADRSLRQTNPVLAAVSGLLDLADARVTATQVLDFAGRDPVRRRFRLDDDDLARIREWVSETGIRWGLDGPHRRRYKLGNVEQNTWRSGLDRVLVGVTMADEEQRLVGGVLPLDDVDSGSIDLAGRFAELVDRLDAAVVAMQAPMTVAGWAGAIADAAHALVATAPADDWQQAQLHRILDEVVEEATVGDAASAVALELGEVRSLLADRLRGRPTRANFRTGHLTVCTLVPMRSVPHRVVCLLGLDDDSFPRRADADGDDLVADQPLVGDGDRRSEDRQLLLDALLAATDRLVITYSGNDERTNAELAPAVPVGELLDVVDSTVVAAGVERARDRIVVRHPLQPFDPRNFEAGALAGDGPWSFDDVTLEGALALRGTRPAAAAFLSGPLPPPPRTEVVELDQLIRFVRHPVRAFLRQRLGISVGDFSDDVGDAIPVELDGLAKWSVGERVLAARLGGASADACAAAEAARGDIPPHGLAGTVYDDIAATVECLVAEAAALTRAGGEVDSVEVSVRLDDGRLLVGTVPGVVGGIARSVTYSKVKAKQRLAAWVTFLALGAGRPADGLEVVTVGRSAKSGRAVSVWRLAPLDADPGEAVTRARRHLHDLVDLYDRGLCEPLPLYCATSAAYAEAVAKGRDGLAAASKEWESSRFDGEDRDLEHRLVLGAVAPFDALVEARPCAGEDGDGWDPAELTRFGRYAVRLWSGLLAAEKVEHR